MRLVSLYFDTGLKEYNLKIVNRYTSREDNDKYIKEKFESTFIFSEEDDKKEYSYKDVVWATFRAYMLTEDDAHKSEMNNIILTELKNGGYV